MDLNLESMMCEEINASVIVRFDTFWCKLIGNCRKMERINKSGCIAEVNETRKIRKSF